MSLAPRSAVLMALLLVGCGKSSPAGSSGASDAAIDARPTGVRWLECTESARAPMETLLLGRHGLEQVDDEIDRLTCVTITLAGAPAFFVQLVGTVDGKPRRLHGVVATDGKTELVPLREARFSWAVFGGRVSFETIDLDGDRSDEVIVHYDDRRQVIAEWIDVIVIRGTTLHELRGPRIAYEDPDLDERCHGVLSRERAGKATHLAVMTSGSAGRSDHCLESGRHVFALEGERIVELTATRR